MSTITRQRTASPHRGDPFRDTDPEILRRANHHDVNVPAVQKQTVHGYGVNGDEDDKK
jgi:hypothetical protein